MLTLAVAGGSVYLIVGDHGAHPAKRAVRASSARSSAAGTHAATTTSSTRGPGFSAGAARHAIVGLLDSYQSAYSKRSTANLARIFSPSVTRHGLAAGGCVVSHGLQAVIGAYTAQFQAGTGTYRLIGISERAIVLEGTTAAHVDAHYAITPGGSGFVDLKFAEAGQGWKISEVYATCS